MKARWTLWFAALAVSGCATMGAGEDGGKVSILVDLDPASSDRTIIVESITADSQGRLYMGDRVSGNILRVDPKSPKPETVARIEPREIAGKKVNADASGVEFNREGDLFIASGPFSEVLRVRAADLNPQKPGRPQTFATGAEGANGIAFDKQGNLYICGGRSGKIYRVGPAGGAAQVYAEIPGFVRTLPDGKTEQATVANGLVFDSKGTLFVSDTARGAIWRISIGADGKPGKPEKVAENSILEGADGIAFDRTGKLWVTANERNALVTVSPDGKLQEVAKNDSKGPLEFPSAIVFVGDTGYISNYDVPRRDNLDASGKTALDGIGASVARVKP
ncbi:MAG TPA: SMP-30/gluconolactonase/LRE family protein [Candidatus Binatia bacterium]|nr:SMP-30/gluconolactonase/LRE family protein [Candidatus Binatia bacterium]